MSGDSVGDGDLVVVSSAGATAAAAAALLAASSAAVFNLNSSFTFCTSAGLRNGRSNLFAFVLQNKTRVY